MELVPGAARTFAPSVSTAYRAGFVERRESDPAVMLGIVALVVVCWLVAVLAAVGLWVVT